MTEPKNPSVGFVCGDPECWCWTQPYETYETYGDPLWLSVHAELAELHREKSATYGTTTDPLANFTDVGHVTGQVPERYALERIVEKASRALHMIESGEGVSVREYPDMASLALCCEALRRRRA